MKKMNKIEGKKKWKGWGVFDNEENEVESELERIKWFMKRMWNVELARERWWEGEGTCNIINIDIIIIMVCVCVCVSL